MRWGWIAAMLLLATPAAAQEFVPDVATLPQSLKLMGQVREECAKANVEAPKITLDGVSPFAGAYLTSGFVYAVGRDCRYITFYRLAPTFFPPGTTRREERDRASEVMGKAATPAFAARLIGDDEKAFFVARWAGQSTCPALLPAIEKLERILAPKLTGDGPYREGYTGITDQSLYNVWVKGVVYPQESSDYELDLKVQSWGDPTDLSRWFEETLTALESCWFDRKPQ